MIASALALRWALSLALGSAVGTLAPATAESTPEKTEEAKQEVAQGRAAAKKGDYATALGHFERALALRPAPSLHFNIAVCHHNLMLKHVAGSPEHEASRRAAVEAYARYLDAKPDASDRAEVERTIDELGGRPPAEDEPWVIERIDPGELPSAPPLQEAKDPATAPPPASGDPLPPPAASDDPVGRLGPFVPISLANMIALSRSGRMEPLPGIGLGLRGAALLGRRHRVAVGGEIAATGQPSSSRVRPVLVTGSIMPVVEYGHPVAGGRVEVGGGGGLGVSLQTLRYTGDVPPVCSVSERGPVSTRGGFLATARFVLSVLLGKKKNHELSLRLSPGIAAYANASRKPDNEAASGETPCSELDTPFEEVGLSSRAALVVTIDLGYAPRF